MRPALKKYHENGFHNVEGWCENHLFVIMEVLANFDRNADGGALEIGVHHGKLFCFSTRLSSLNTCLTPLTYSRDKN